MTTNSRQITDYTVVAGFNLELPEKFNVAPIATIPVSRNYTARVFQAQKISSHHANRDSVTTGYRVVVRHNVSGLAPGGTRGNHYNSNGDSFEEDNLHVRLCLENWVSALAPKKRTQKIVEDYDE